MPYKVASMEVKKSKEKEKNTTTMERIIVWFSCGAPSACAAKAAIDRYGAERVTPVYCDLSLNEDDDNLRFRKNCEDWFHKPITVIKNPNYDTVEEVFEAKQYMSGIHGAVCTGQMKKVPRFAFQRPDDIHIFGLTADEPKRIANFTIANSELNLVWILSELSLSKSQCFYMVKQAGIDLPRRYEMGFRNNNCECCVKATSLAYWVLSRRVNPVSFARRAKQSRQIGVRLTRLNGVRIFLDEIPPDEQIPKRFLKKMENVQCGPECKG
jgi:hypothetical protein